MKIDTGIYPYNPELSGLPFLLKGIGGTRYQGHIKRPEGYRWNQILFCREGKGILKYEDKTIETSENTFIFLPKDAEHEYYPSENIWEVDWVAFDGSACTESLKILNMTDIMVVTATDTSDMKIIFDKMIRSQQSDIIYSGYSCSSLVYEYIIGFRRLFATEEDNKRSRYISVLVPALKYINDNYGKDIPISYLASLAGVTHQHLCKLFKSSLNMSPVDYLNGKRIQEAKRMLRETDMPVARISEECGFSDPCYFCTVFKKKAGVSPSVYRMAGTILP